MNILFVWDGDYPWDIRVDKVCSSLHQDGNDVHIVCRNLARKVRSDTYNGYKIHRITSLPRILGALNSAYTFPAFFSPVWLWEIYRQVKKNNCDFIVVRDLPMALAGAWIGRLFKIPYVVDMAECYPEMLRCTKQFEGFSFRNYFLRNPYLADLIEKWVMRDVSQVWVMIEESRDRLIQLGVPENKIRIISNTPVVSRFSRNQQQVDERRINNITYHLVYVGLLNPSRGLDTAIRGVARYIQDNPSIDFKFTIAGRGKAEGLLHALVADLKVSECVKFAGWIDNSEVPSLIASADVGIVPHHQCSHWNNTIPNKLFDYMASCKPVIVSDVRPMARIVKQVDCGRVYEDYNVGNLCDVLGELSDPVLRNKLSSNGINEVNSIRNWATDEKVLLDSVHQLT